MYNKDVFISFLQRKLFFSVALSGVLTGLPFVFPHIGILSFIAVIPFLYVLYRSYDIRFSVAYGFLFGASFGAMAMIWILHTHPLVWAGISSVFASLLLVLFFWLLAATLFGLIGSFFSFCFSMIATRTAYDTLFVPALWILCEYVRAFFLSIMWWAPGAPIGPHWTFGFMGYPVLEFPLFASFAGIGGMYLVGFIVLAINTALAIWFVSRRASSLFIGGIILAMAAGGGMLLSAQNTKSSHNELTVALVQTHLPSFFIISQEEFDGRIEIVKQKIARLLASDAQPDIVVLPEDLRFFSSLTQEEGRAILEQFAKRKQTLFIDSDRFADDGIYSSLFFLHTNEPQRTHTKELLAPFGEYMPVFASLGSYVFGIHNLTRSLTHITPSRSNTSVTIGSVNGLGVYAQFCSEVVSPVVTARGVKSGGSIIINTASHSAFYGSSVMRRQTMQFARARAVEQNRFVALAGNMVPSFVVDNHGRVTTYGSTEDDFVIASVTPIQERSFYAHTPFLFPLLFIVIVVGSFLYKRRRHTNAV